MTLENFITKFAEQFDETPAEEIKAETLFRELEEWGSLLGLSVISMIDDEYDIVELLTSCPS
jgi:acyl carrier protein